jgi:valyl-tRNA synthetase
MPPPNANGSLHSGHVMYTVDDIATRYWRMKGHPTLWLPGTDHAGIETQVVFERKLAEEGKSRFDFTPKEFYDAALKFVLENENNILDQMRSLGFSADWSRKKFTLDEDILEVVYETFKRLHHDGYIYRGNRIVNWCPHCRSSFADIEIKHRDQIDPLYYIKYGPFVVATVRPEPMFADTGIAVNPADDRYQQYIGKTVSVETLWGTRELPVIADHHVDPAFGTGVVKLTPAHDQNDWDMAQRHNLEVISGVGTDGTMTELAGKYAGMKTFDARQAVAADLEAAGLMDHVEMDYAHSIAYHDRCGTLIEPLVTEQWWMSVAELKKPAIKAIENGDIKFYPTRFKKQALDWLEGLRDWNISRQNWFGIRIPVYYNGTGDSSKPDYIIATDEAEAIKTYGEGGYEAETDTFDTWFSSGQWPYATLMTTGDFDQFYPTSVMATMRDILYLWVTRMIMFGLYRTGEVPFREVYLWGSVNDGQGRKMSKSKGNVVNPLDITAQYGSDALRLALTIGVTQGTGLSLEKVEGYRNFCNKLWNVARFTIEKLGPDYSFTQSEVEGPTPPEPVTLADKWILDKFSQRISSISKDIEAYRFSEAGQAVYSLLWNDLADWYIEASKSTPNPSVLAYCLETILKLAHPFAPFVTEAIWQEMAWQKYNLIISAWPEVGERYKSDATHFETIKELVTELRALGKSFNLKDYELLHQSAEYIAPNADLITQLTKVKAVTQTEKGRGLSISYAGPNAWLDIDAATIGDYRKQLETEFAAKDTYLKTVEKQLENPRLPDHIRAQTQARKDEAELVRSKLDEQIKHLQAS